MCLPWNRNKHLILHPCEVRKDAHRRDPADEEGKQRNCERNFGPSVPFPYDLALRPAAATATPKVEHVADATEP